MYKATFSKSILALALCGITPACVASGEPDASDDLAGLGEDSAQATEALVHEPSRTGGEAVQPALAAALRDQGFLSGDTRAPDPRKSAAPSFLGHDDEGNVGLFSVVVTSSTWVSPYRGGFGGGFYSLSCAPGEIAVGIDGRAGGRVDQLGLYCATVRSDGFIGQAVFRGYTGGGGGSYFRSMCPAGYAIAGLRGRSRTLVDQIQIVCDTLPGTSLYVGNAHGSGADSLAWTDISPYRYFLTEIHGRSGSLIDALEATYSYVAP